VSSHKLQECVDLSRFYGFSCLCYLCSAFLFFIVMFAFAVFGHLLFGGQMEDWRDMSSSFFAITKMAVRFELSMPSPPPPPHTHTTHPPPAVQPA
jgi:hypothetical protein